MTHSIATHLAAVLIGAIIGVPLWTLPFLIRDDGPLRHDERDPYA